METIRTTAEASPRLDVGFVASARNPAITARQMRWDEFTAELSRPEIRGQKDGAGFIPASFAQPYRKAENVIGISCIVLDVDGKDAPPPAPAEAHQWLRSQGWAHVIHTSFSHTPDQPRYRCCIRIDAPISVAHWKNVHAIIRSALPESISAAIDTACTDPARFYYLPAVPAGRAELFEHYHHDGKALCSSTLETLAQVIEEERRRIAQKRPQIALQRGQWSEGRQSIIETFNASYSVSDVLEQSGYTRRGRKWLAPESKSGMPGITVLGDKVFSHHASDPLRSGHAEDSFGCYALIFHGGDQKAAVRALAKQGVQNARR